MHVYIYAGEPLRANPPEGRRGQLRRSLGRDMILEILRTSTN